MMIVGGSNTMSERNAQPMRPVWRSLLAILAVIANMILPAAWSQAASASSIFGDDFSLCLAGSSKNSETPANHLPDDPDAAAYFHCSLCLYSGSFEGPAGSANTETFLADYPVVISAGYGEPAFTPQIQALTFDARAPPA